MDFTVAGDYTYSVVDETFPLYAMIANKKLSSTQENKEVVLVNKPSYSTTKDLSTSTPENREVDLVNNPFYSTTKDLSSSTPENREVVLINNPSYSTTKVPSPSTPKNREVHLVNNPFYSTTKELSSFIPENREVVLVTNPSYSIPSSSTQENRKVALVTNPFYSTTKDPSTSNREVILVTNFSYSTTKVPLTSTPENREVLLLTKPPYSKIEINKDETTRNVMMICVAVTIALISVVATLCFAYTFVEISKLKKNHTHIEAQNTTGNLYQNCLMLENKFQQIIDNLGSPGHYQHYPAVSCAAALLYDPSSSSGHYWVRSSNGSAIHVYCDMTRSCGNSTRGWMRVAELDMTNRSNQCPTGLRSRPNSNIRTCARDSISGGCSSVTFFTRNIEFSRVCGKFRAYQFGETSAFSTSLSIDTHYVDGISLTHGRPRRHIWTFAAALDDTSLCPCNNETIQTPGFVGNDYFCDAGNIRDGDPLWDREGCSAGSTCCSFNNPPWFYKQLPQPTTDDNIEMRLCRDGHNYNEDVVIETVDLYIQ